MPTLSTSLAFGLPRNRHWSATTVRYDVLVKTKKPAFQQVYFNREPGDYRRLTRWIKEMLHAIDQQSFYPNFGWTCKQCPFKRTCWNM